MRATCMSLLLFAASCAGPRATIGHVELQSAAERRPMTYATYTPPGWDGKSQLPLVVFLHGGGDDYTVLDKHSVVGRTFDRLIEDGTLPPFVMVAPDGKRGFWRNWADGSHSFEDWVMDEVIPDARSRFNVRQDAAGTHLMGISMGGAGTLSIGLKHLDAFGSLAVWSAPIFTKDQISDFLDGGFLSRVMPLEDIFGQPTTEEIQRDHAYTRTSTPESLRGTKLMVGAGTVDMAGILGSTRAFHEHLETAGVEHSYVTYKGGHRWVDWARVFPVALCKHLAEDTCKLPASGFYTLTEMGPSDAEAGLESPFVTTP